VTSVLTELVTKWPLVRRHHAPAGESCWERKLGIEPRAVGVAVDVWRQPQSFALAHRLTRPIRSRVHAAAITAFQDFPENAAADEPDLSGSSQSFAIYLFYPWPDGRVRGA